MEGIGNRAHSMPKIGQAFVSVILPVRNEEQFISETISCFLNNDFPNDRMEIIVIDGHSNDGTRVLVEKFVKVDSRVKLIDNPAKITPVGMNLGVKAARGEYILVAGCHSTYAQDYLKSCVEVIERTGAGCVGGYMETLPGGPGLVPDSIACATSSLFGVGGAKFRTGGNCECQVDALGVSFTKREVFDKVGLYNPLLVRNQDIEFSSRVRKAGYTIIASPAIKLKYHNRSTYKGLREQAFSNGKWNAYTLWLTGGGLRLRHFIPAAFVIALIGLILFTLWIDGIFKWLLFAYLGLYLSVAIFDACRMCILTKQLNLLALILASYIQMHLCYGFGTIYGLATIPLHVSDWRRLSSHIENAGRL